MFMLFERAFHASSAAGAAASVAALRGGPTPFAPTPHSFYASLLSPHPCCLVSETRFIGGA